MLKGNIKLFNNELLYIVIVLPRFVRPLKFRDVNFLLSFTDKYDIIFEVVGNIKLVILVLSFI